MPGESDAGDGDDDEASGLGDAKDFSGRNPGGSVVFKSLSADADIKSSSREWESMPISLDINAWADNPVDAIIKLSSSRRAAVDIS